MNQNYNFRYIVKFAIGILFITLCTHSTASDDEWRFNTNEDIISIGDIHSDFEAFTSIMQKAKLLDSENNWIAEQKHLVNTGGFLDGGPESRKIMDLFMKLEKQAASAGGKFHILLGNHEVMNLIGDRRHVSVMEFATYEDHESAEYRVDRYRNHLKYYDIDDSAENQSAFDETYPPGYFGLHAAMKQNGKYGSWLSTKPFIIIINNQVFTHGGLSKTVGELGLKGINIELADEMRNYAKNWNSLVDIGLFQHTFPQQKSIDTATLLVDGFIVNDRFNSKKNIKIAINFLKASGTALINPESPIWYQGTALCHQYSEETLVKKVLKQLNADSAYLGHSTTSSTEVESRFDGKVFLQDTGMQANTYSGQASLVIHKANSTHVFDTRHGKHNILEQSPRAWNKPYDMSIEELEKFLLTADVIASKDIGIGISKPQKLTLQLGDKIIHAIYKNIGTAPKRLHKPIGRKYHPADSYYNELAAYELNKLLELDIIPPTVRRRYKGKMGSYQYWINNGINSTDMKDKHIPYQGYCSKDSQISVMRIFDALIFNTDRNTGNIVFQKDEWQLWLIDHSRGFSTELGLPKGAKWEDMTLSDKFRKRISTLSNESLKSALSRYLTNKQISFIIKRRDNILVNL